MPTKKKSLFELDWEVSDALGNLHIFTKSMDWPYGVNTLFRLNGVIGSGTVYFFHYDAYQTANHDIHSATPAFETLYNILTTEWYEDT